MKKKKRIIVKRKMLRFKCNLDIDIHDQLTTEHEI